MKTKKATHLTAGGLAMAAAVFSVSAVESAYLTAGRSPAFSVAATSEPTAMPGAKPASPTPPKKEETIHAPVTPVPAESRTPEEAAARAADPKDPSGALIVQPPLGSGAPGKPR